MRLVADMTLHHPADARHHDPETSTRYVLPQPRGFDECHYRGCNRKATVSVSVDDPEAEGEARTIRACDQCAPLLTGQPRTWGPGPGYDPTGGRGDVDIADLRRKYRAGKRVAIAGMYPGSGAHLLLLAYADGTAATFIERNGKRARLNRTKLRDRGWIASNAITDEGRRVLALVREVTG